MPRTPTIEDVEKYIRDALAVTGSAEEDSDFMAGYHAAIQGLYEDLFMTQTERALARARHGGGKQ